MPFQTHCLHHDDLQQAECDAVDEKGNGTFVSIRADHVTKIAVELLMDFC
jgi:hypothetical protein